jgi:ferric-dicitrate binding protein FerR (iron transport regulator)
MVAMSRNEERKQFDRRRRGRNLALLAALVAVVILLYVLPFVRMGGGQ